MAKIKFIANDGTETDADASSGTSIMQVAVNNGIQGIDAECGGALSCATCHVHFDNEWFEKLDSSEWSDWKVLSPILGFIFHL